MYGWVQSQGSSKPGKMYPKTIQYTFTDGDKKASYTIAQEYELEARDPVSTLPAPVKAMLKVKGLHPSTSRNFAKGTLTFTDGKETIERTGDMIYEFVYMGLTVKDKMENF